MDRAHAPGRHGQAGSHTAAAAALICALVLAGCQTTYRSYNQPAARDEPLLKREVTYHVSREIYTTLPECAVVLAPESSALAPESSALAPDQGMPAPETKGPAPDEEESDSGARSPRNDARVRAKVAGLAGPSLARHLSGRINRVIAPLQRRRIERRQGLNLTRAADRRLLARRETCRSYLRWRVITAEDNYFLVWSQRQIGIEAALYRSADDRLLWKAVHVGRRADGGLPLSPLSVPFAAFTATSFREDRDIVASMIDDVVRRLLVTLPDLR